MLKGIIIQQDVKDAKNLSPSEMLIEEACAVVIDDMERKIFLWVGDKASVGDKFKAARIAHVLNWKLFGGAARIIQDKNEIRSVLSKYARIDEELPKGEIKAIIG